MVSPIISIEPFVNGSIPASAFRSVPWPLPVTPAIPRISPERASKLTSDTRFNPCSLFISRFFATKRGLPIFALDFLIFSSTFLPIINSASSSGLVLLVSLWATILPALMTDTWSVIFIISRSL